MITFCMVAEREGRLAAFLRQVQLFSIECTVARESGDGGSFSCDTCDRGGDAGIGAGAGAGADEVEVEGGGAAVMSAGHTPRAKRRYTVDGEGEGEGKGSDSTGVPTLLFGDQEQEEQEDQEEREASASVAAAAMKDTSLQDLSKLLSMWVEIHGHHPYSTKCLELSSAIPHSEWLRVIELIQVGVYLPLDWPLVHSLISAH